MAFFIFATHQKFYHIRIETKNMTNDKQIIPIERIQQVIYLFRGQKVMLDYDLADLYGVPTKVLKQAVKRKMDRFPSDFMFELTNQEFTNLRSQIVTSSLPHWGGTRYSPMAFTQEGVAMLSSALRTDRAVQVNITIMRAFVRLRKILTSNADLARKLEALEKKYDSQFKVVFDAIRQLMAPPEKSRKKIGFQVKEPKARYGKKQ
jgi:hypothetical protein